MDVRYPVNPKLHETENYDWISLINVIILDNE